MRDLRGAYTPRLVKAAARAGGWVAKKAHEHVLRPAYQCVIRPSVSAAWNTAPVQKVVENAEGRMMRRLYSLASDAWPQELNARNYSSYVKDLRTSQKTEPDKVSALTM